MSPQLVVGQVSVAGDLHVDGARLVRRSGNRNVIRVFGTYSYRSGPNGGDARQACVAVALPQGVLARTIRTSIKSEDLEFLRRISKGGKCKLIAARR